MKLFTRWFIVVSATLVGCYFVGKAGGFGGLLKYDSSYLGVVILVIGAAATLYMGKISQAIDLANAEVDYPATFKEEILKKIGVVRYAAEACFDLGLLSTIIGLVLMFLGMGGDTNSLISAIKNGLSTAFIPTLVGMVANFILRLQMFVAEYAIKD